MSRTVSTQCLKFNFLERAEIKKFQKSFERANDNLKALQTTGMLVAEVLQILEKSRFIIKSSAGPRYIVGCKPSIESKVKIGSRVSLDLTTLTIMTILPPEVDPAIFAMAKEEPGLADYSEIGGLAEQIKQIREVIELPLKNPELYQKVGIKCPKGVLLYGPPGTGKTLVAKALASSMNCSFLKIVASSIVDKYIGESSRIIRDMFNYAKANAPCIMFIDEIDAIGGKRTNDGSSSDREIQRTMMEMLSQLDGFKELVNVKVLFATNRPDVLDSALLRPGRIDRKIEIPTPNAAARAEILKIHSKKMIRKGDFDLESLVKLTEGFNGADIRNVCTEAGMFAIRADRDYVIEDDFLNAIRKIHAANKLVSKLNYKQV